MAKRTVTALFDNYEDAAEAVRRLESAGVSHGDISIVSNDATQRDRYSNASTSGSATSSTDDGDADGAGTGATVGTLIGGGAGLLAGLGLLAIPGLGPVVAAGWLISTITGAGVGAALGGLVGGLVDAGVDENDAHAYAEGVRRGGTLVTVRAEDSNLDRVLDILDDEGSVNMDEREASWRSEGWTGTDTSSDDAHRTAGPIGAAASTTSGIAGGALGSTAATMGMGSSSTDYDRTTSSDYDRSTSTSAGVSGSMDRSGSTGTGASGAMARAADAVSDALTGSDRDQTTATGTTAMGATGRDKEVIPVVEEQLQVGKRAVEHGRVRVRSYVTEQPVSEQVSLREENVNVERRPVDRPITGADAFQERTIEMTEQGEEAVVSKEARVTEEVVLDKDVEQRSQTVQDTVRRTEVEVEDERTGLGTGTTGTDRDRR